MSFLVEEVVGFSHKAPKENFTYLELFIEKCRSHGYAVRAVTHDANVWIDWPRPRIYIYGVAQQAGGEKAAEWLLGTITELLTVYQGSA